MQIRVILVFLLLTALSGAIIYIFWREEIRYSVPTPIPNQYISVAVNQSVHLSTSNLPKGISLYLHFYNPDCPCSRFNASHIRELIWSHGDSISAFIVVPSETDIAKAKNEFGSVLTFLVDANGEIAKACGVYSTPQAAIIDKTGNLYYRGNYNRARYCTVKATNYAELALVSLINGAKPPVFDLQATQSYGCSLPTSSIQLKNN